MTIDNILQELKQEMNTDKTIQKTATQTPNNEDVSLEDLGIVISPVEQISENLQKIASAVEKTSTIEELVKVAEKANNTDLTSLVKIADKIADRIADKIIDRLAK